MDLSTFRQVLELADTAGATRYYQTQSVGAIASGTNNGLSTPATIRFTRSGFVSALYGQVTSGAVADYGGTSMRVQIGGTEDLFVDGLGAPAFAPFLALFGGVFNKQRLLRRVNPGDLWTFTFQTTIVGGVTPSAQLGFLDDEDCSSLMKSLAQFQPRGR